MKLGTIQTLAITVFVIILIGVVGYLMFANTHPSPKTYLNSRYGLWFTYPDNYVLEESAATGTQTGMVVTLRKRALLSPETTHIQIGMYDATSTTETSLLSWIKKSPYSYFPHAYQETPGLTTIANQKAYLYTWHDGEYGTTLVTFYKNNILMFTVTYSSQTDLDNRAVFTDLIASVKFMDANASSTSMRAERVIAPLEYTYTYVEK